MPPAERNSEASLATCTRRIGNGVASPATAGNPSPSQREKMYSSASCDARAQVEPPREALRHLAHRRERFPSPRSRVGDRVLDQPRAHLRRAAEPDVGSVELENLRRVGRVDQIEGGSMGDVVAEQLRRLVPVGRAAGSVQERDVVGVGELLGGCSGELAEPDRQHGGAQGVLERLPGAEVGSDREGADDLGSANRPLRRARCCCGTPDGVYRHTSTILLLLGKRLRVDPGGSHSARSIARTPPLDESYCSPRAAQRFRRSAGRRSRPLACDRDPARSA